MVVVVDIVIILVVIGERQSRSPWNVNISLKMEVLVWRHTEVGNMRNRTLEGQQRGNIFEEPG